MTVYAPGASSLVRNDHRRRQQSVRDRLRSVGERGRVLRLRRFAPPLRMTQIGAPPLRMTQVGRASFDCGALRGAPLGRHRLRASEALLVSGWPTTLGDEARGGADFGEIYAGVDTHLVEHVEHVFGADVAGSAGRVGTAAESAGRRVEGRDAVLQRRRRRWRARCRACRGSASVTSSSGIRSAQLRTSASTWLGTPTPIVSPIESESQPISNSLAQTYTGRSWASHHRRRTANRTPSKRSRAPTCRRSSPRARPR